MVVILQATTIALVRFRPIPHAVIASFRATVNNRPKAAVINIGPVL
jgi:hypothetical protein